MFRPSACWPSLPAGSGGIGDAEKLLRRALDLSPGFDAARHNLAVVLHRQGKSAEARWRRSNACSRATRGRRATACCAPPSWCGWGIMTAAIATYAALLASHPHQPKAWMSYGHVLKTVGRQAGQHRRLSPGARARQPTLGEAWWSLANLKTVRFDDADIAAMEARCSSPELAEEDRFHLHFALGKALEDRRAVRGLLRPLCARQRPAPRPARL